MPDAYNRSSTASQVQRHRIHRPASYARFGAACRSILDLVRHELSALNARIGRPPPRMFALGLSSLPPMRAGVDVDEPAIVEELHTALGLRCTQRWGVFELGSRHTVEPIDRYNVWGARKRDTIHPFFNGQFALVQLILNHVCGACVGVNVQNG